MARNHYYVSIADLSHARGADPELTWDGVSPAAFATALQQALREDNLFEHWRATQPDPDAVDKALAQNDPAATVSAQLQDLHTEVDVVTELPMRVLHHRLDTLIGRSWELRDMRAA